MTVLAACRVSVLLRGHAVRPGGTGQKGGVEVKLKTRIKFQLVLVDLDDVNLVVTFKMDLTEVVLV